MRKIHELMIQDVILSHTNLYKFVNSGYLTTKDTFKQYTEFTKRFSFNTKYKGEFVKVSVLQYLCLNGEYVDYFVSARIGNEIIKVGRKEFNKYHKYEKGIKVLQTLLEDKRGDT
jgi:hypothetical protein